MVDPLNPEEVGAIAIHLPQFHPVPQNDEWWGTGFTEWTNVARARPLFPGHYQPHLPSDLGFYDLRLPEARAAQAKLAAKYGIRAFCYYHYWFGGRRILERPVNDIVSSGEPDFPFCLCWANENWTRTWTSLDREILLAQDYSTADDLAHIRELIPILSDSRYLRIDGKLALFIYRPDQLPDAVKTLALWRDEVRKAGLGELFAGAFLTSPIDVKQAGFDVGVEFVPRGFDPPSGRAIKRFVTRWWSRTFARMRGTRQAAVHLYDDLADVSENAGPPGTLEARDWLRCVTPGWDNSARRKNAPIIFTGASPARYGRWLEKMVRWTRRSVPAGQRFVFINAWNEWAEGNHLEPDQRDGHAYLEATRRALSAGNAG